MRRPFLPLVPLPLLLLSQCGKSPSAGSGDAASGEVIATVAGRAITADDLRAEAEWRMANHQPLPDAEALLEDMIRREALVERARREGLEDDPATRRRLDSLLIASLRERGIDREVREVTVSDEELRAAYEARKDEFARPGVDRFAILFQEVTDKSSEARRDEARQRLEQGVSAAKSSPPGGGRGPAATGFGAVAIDHSDDQVSRYRGGDLGWIESTATETRVPDAVLEAGRELAKGAVSDVIETASGLYVIMKTDTRAGGVPGYDEVSETLRRQLLVEKRREFEEAFLADALESAGVTRDPEAARAVDLPAPTGEPPAPTAPPADPTLSDPR